MYSVILLAAGTGNRMELGYNKMLHPTNHKPVVLHSLEKFLSDDRCAQLILIVNESEVEIMTGLIPTQDRIQLVTGGAERQDSVYQGLQHVREGVVLVHDGARVLVTQSMIDECYSLATSGVAAVVGVPVKDTIKRVDENGVIIETLPREELFNSQTPQSAPTNMLLLAHKRAKAERFLGTDESSLIERYTDLPVYMAQGSYTNIKLTTPDDLVIAKQLLQKEEV